MSVNGNIIDEIITSRFLKENIALKIYLPKNYSPLYTYQLLIAQDGDDYLQQGKLVSKASQLIEKKQIEQVIIVMVHYQNVNDRYEKYHPNGKKNKAYIRFLAEELVPFIEEKFKTYELASSRTLIGDSLAATVGLHAAFEYPYTFGQVIAQSPYIHNKTIDGLRAFNKPEQLRLYHVIGNQEAAVKTTDGVTKDFLTMNQNFHKLCKEKGIELFYDEFIGDHTWNSWQNNLNRALTTMLS